MSDMDTAASILSTATAVDPAVSSNDSTPAQHTDDSQPAADTTDGAVDSSDDGSDSEGGKGGSPDGAAGGDKKLPTTQQVRAALKAFRDSNPEFKDAARMLNDGYSRAEAYKEVFGSVDDARTVKTQIDALGGLEGLATLQTNAAAYEETDAKIISGDPSVLDALIEDAPDGFKKLAPAYLSKLQKLDPAVFTQTLQPHFVKALTDSNFPNVVDYLESKLADKPELLEVVRGMKSWFAQQKQLSERYASSQNDPEREKISEGWTQLEKERRADLDNHVRTSMTPYINKEFGGKLASYSDSLKAMTPAMQRSVAVAAVQKLGAALEADKVYKQQIEAMMNVKKPDRAKILAFNQAKVAAVAPRIIEAVVKDFGLKLNGKKPPAAAATNTQRRPGSQDVPAKIIALDKPPADKDIDWNHPNMTQEAYIRGRAVLKDKRWVSWKK